MDPLLFLFLLVQIVIAIFLYTLIRAFLNSRKVVPLLARVFLGIILTTGFLWDFIWARWMLEIGYFTTVQFYEYRYIYEVLLGMVSLYIIGDLRFHDQFKRIVFKGIVIVIGTNFVTALFLLNTFVPEMRANSVGFLFLLNKDVPWTIQLFLVFTKIFGLGGYSFFLLSVVILLVKSKLFSRGSTIWLMFGIATLIDLQIFIPILDQITTWAVEITFFNWIAGFVCVITARLYRMQFRTITELHELSIVHKSGATIFSMSDSSVDCDLIGSAMVGVSALLREITGSEKPPSVIDEEDRKILLEYGQHVFILIIAEKDSQVLQIMLRTLLAKFEQAYGALLEHWEGNTSIFKNARILVDSVFSNVTWLNCQTANPTPN